MTGCCPLCGGNFASDEIVLVPDNHLVLRGGKQVYLPPKQWELFAKLYAARGRAVSRGALLEWIYQLEHNEPGIKIISVFAFKVRRKLKPLGIKIISHFAFGYGLEIEGTSRVVNEAEGASVLQSPEGVAG